MSKEYNEWYWKLYRWCKWDLKHFPGDIKQGFINLWRWLPIVWKDRDWDDHFIFEALKFKLKNTADYFEENQRFVGWENEVKYIRICEKLIKRIQDDYYQMEYCDDKYSITKMRIEENGNLEFDTIKDNLDEYINKYPLTKKKVLSLDKYETYILTKNGFALAIGMERHLKARKLLFKIMERRIEAWWD